MHTEPEPPGTFVTFSVFLHPILCAERRPRPPLPLDGPILLKFTPDVSDKLDPSSAPATSCSTAFSAVMEPKLAQSSFFSGSPLLVLLPLNSRWISGLLFCKILVAFLVLVSALYLILSLRLSAFSKS
ncbi:hypothetical protein C8J57DRAFT_1510327 [Mycena rebaudengoi]|nr:hypothetical protein C8J57DRAFT_1510327 [Mycena rebaudengoi]